MRQGCASSTAHVPCLGFILLRSRWEAGCEPPSCCFGMWECCTSRAFARPKAAQGTLASHFQPRRHQFQGQQETIPWRYFQGILAGGSAGFFRRAPLDQTKTPSSLVGWPQRILPEAVPTTAPQQLAFRAMHPLNTEAPYSCHDNNSHGQHCPP